MCIRVEIGLHLLPLQSRGIYRVGVLQAGDLRNLGSFSLCPVWLFCEHCKSNKRSVLIAEHKSLFKDRNVRNINAGRISLTPKSVVRAYYPWNWLITEVALAGERNRNFSPADCIKTYQAGISQTNCTHL